MGLSTLSKWDPVVRCLSYYRISRSLNAAKCGCPVFQFSLPEIWERSFQAALQWRHNGYFGASNQRIDCLLNRLSRFRSKKTAKLRVTGLCEGNSPVTGEFSSQRASNAENVSIWWRHHGPSNFRAIWRLLKRRNLMSLTASMALVNLAEQTSYYINIQQLGFVHNMFMIRRVCIYVLPING